MCETTSLHLEPCGITMETRFRISFLLTYRLTVKLFTLFVESGLGQHAIGFLKSCLGILSRLVLSGPSVCFHLERSVIQTNKQTNFASGSSLTHPTPRTSNCYYFPQYHAVFVYYRILDDCISENDHSQRT